MNTSTIITYGEGGYDESKPNNNAVYIAEQDYDEDGNPVGDPRVQLDLLGEETPA